MAFLHNSPGDIPANKTEPTDAGKVALAQFRLIIEGRRHCKYWSSSKDLGGVMSRAVAILIKTKPAVGWVRANLVPDESAAQEIVRLRNRIDELELQASQTAMNPPKGSEDLAQGEEDISLRFGFEIQNVRNEQAHKFTWNELFAILGPTMLGSVSELGLKNKLAEAFSNRFRDIHNTVIYRPHIRDEDFQRVKIQFRALGLINTVASPFPPTGKGDGSTYWILTPYGDGILTRISAVRSAKKETPVNLPEG